ncbi:hypothetical protein TRIUR3_30564 [Triticum urartu]|uniref:Uncharacterized protein n=1 Tax=Triticum urartu TaxID=4572 RepID=M7Z8H0_TRIUA|nr:hypothetical protein TRIUR3_30564 [Triticum urartu]
MKGLLRQQEKMAGGAGRTEGGGGTGADEPGAPDHCSGGSRGQGDPGRVEVAGGLDRRSGAAVPGGAEEPWTRCRRWRQGTVGAEGACDNTSNVEALEQRSGRHGGAAAEQRQKGATTAGSKYEVTTCHSWGKNWNEQGDGNAISPGG